MTTYAWPLELQNSYLQSKNYPENLIPNGILTYRSKLMSYKNLLDEVEPDLCLVDEKDNVDGIFEIPIIDLGTTDGKSEFLATHMRMP
jgi:hypothetical protein